MGLVEVSQMSNTLFDVLDVRANNPMAYADGERWRFSVNTVEMTGTVRGDYMRTDDGRWFLLTNCTAV